jgi:hypothetical protein
MRPLAIPLLAALLLWEGAIAAEIEGVRIPDRARIGDAEVVLNGAGVRTRFLFKVYVGALYLPQKTSSAQAAIADPRAKRVAMHILRELTSEQLFSALKDGLAANHAPGDLEKMEPQAGQLEGIFRAVKAARAGDVIWLDHLPGAGTRITVNAQDKGTVAGEEFNRALLRIWLGDQPADADLKRAMLGGQAVR